MEMKYKRYCRICGKLIPKKSENWSRYKKKKFCSNKCKSLSFRKNRKIGRCIVCGKEFEYREGQIVLDPFLGSGTTAVACKKLKRKFIGIEREKEYVKIAEARLKSVEDELF